MTLDQFLRKYNKCPFCRLNAFKYLFRSDRKNGVEDIKKANWYLTRFLMLEELKNEKNTDTV